MNDLIKNIDKLHTTELGAERIRHNLELGVADVVNWCKLKIVQANKIVRQGKNWYVYADNAVITINAHSYTVITAHKTNPRNSTEPQITRADLSDMDEILTLQYAAYQSEALIHNDFTIQPLRETLDEVIAEYQKGVVLKAVQDGAIIGSVRAYAAGGTAYIGKLMVHPEYRGKGLGKRLLAAIEREFPHLRYELFTSGKSDRNLHLYEAAGYVRFWEETDASGIKFVYLEKERC